MDKLGVVFFPAFDWAISPTHPEREERLLYTMDQLCEEGLFDLCGITLHRPILASPFDIESTHFCLPDINHVCREQHFASAGGAIASAKLVLDGKAKKSFGLIRPPGHHAMRVSHGGRGFCNINNEAIMVDYIRRNYGIKKIAIVDTDCHHGDGTQDVFWNDPDVLFISIHQDGRTLYPGSGFIYEQGGINALGKTINIPLPPESDDDVFLYTVRQMVLPILKDFQPELVINSAGQDNHYSDPITNMNISALGYAEMTRLLDPDIVVLEGGYSIHGALPYVNLGIALSLAGYDYSGVCEPDYAKRRGSSNQQKKLLEYTKKIETEVMKAYFTPSEMPSEGKFRELDGNLFFHREREIYYDTDGILENQDEYVVQCDKCAGLLYIETRVGYGLPFALINIPFNACPSCRNLGDSIYEKALLSKKFQSVKMQNNYDSSLK